MRTSVMRPTIKMASNNSRRSSRTSGIAHSGGGGGVGRCRRDSVECDVLAPPARIVESGNLIHRPLLRAASMQRLQKARTLMIFDQSKSALLRGQFAGASPGFQAGAGAQQEYGAGLDISGQDRRR